MTTPRDHGQLGSRYTPTLVGTGEHLTNARRAKRSQDRRAMLPLGWAMMVIVCCCIGVGWGW